MKRALILSILLFASAALAADPVNIPLTLTVENPVKGAPHGYIVSRTSLKRLGPPTALPEGFAGKTDKEKSEWAAKLVSPSATPSAIAQFTLDTAGKFTTTAIPGVYSAHARIYEKTADGNPGDEVARGTDYFVIHQPPMTPEKAAKPDPVSITLKPPALLVLRPGDKAPDTPFETVDGKPASLADYKGKIVLVDFWASWCPSCIADTPRLKTIHEKFGKDPNFVLLSLSVDRDTTAWKNYLTKEALAWPQGHAGIWHEAKTPDTWGLVWIPTVFLIDAEGKILYKAKSSEDPLAEQIEKALKKL